MKHFLLSITLIFTSLILFTTNSKASFTLEAHDGGILVCHQNYFDKNGVKISYRAEAVKCATQYLLRSDDGGIRNCYMADQYGTTFGAKVKVSHCLTKFLGYFLDAVDGGHLVCHESFSDKNGVTISYRTEDVRCATQYLLRSDDGGIRNCYMADQYGTTFGSKVEMSYCASM